MGFQPSDITSYTGSSDPPIFAPYIFANTAPTPRGVQRVEPRIA